MTLRPLAKHAPRYRAPYWTRERVIDGLRRYYRAHGDAPLSSHAWQVATKSRTLPPYRPYPSFATILRYYRTMRQAWAAAGIVTDRAHEDFTPEEHWYLREAAGLISREEMARDLRRTPAAVHKYLCMYGLNSYRQHGWSLRRAANVLGLRYHRLQWYVKHGRLTGRRGSKVFFLDPVDLLVVEEVDWTKPPRELEVVVRRRLYTKLLGLMVRLGEAR